MKYVNIQHHPLLCLKCPSSSEQHISLSLELVWSLELKRYCPTSKARLFLESQNDRIPQVGRDTQGSLNPAPGKLILMPSLIFFKSGYYHTLIWISFFKLFVNACYIQFIFHRDLRCFWAVQLIIAQLTPSSFMEISLLLSGEAYFNTHILKLFWLPEKS